MRTSPLSFIFSAILLLALFIPKAIEAQDWFQSYPELFPEEELSNQTSFNTRLFEGIVQTEDGGFLTWGAEGYAENEYPTPNPLDIVLSKTDLAGNLQWSQIYENGQSVGTNDLESFTMAANPTGDGYLGFGRTTNTSVTTFRGIIFGDSGEILSTFDLAETDIVTASTVPINSTTKIVKVVPSPDNTFLVLASNYAPYFASNAEGNHSWVSKIDLTGNVLWTSVLDNTQIPLLSGFDDITLIMNSLAVFPNGEMVVSGMSSPFNAQILFKLASNGNQLWRKSEEIFSSNSHVDVLAHPSGDLLVKGVAYNWNTHLSRLNAQGDTVWTQFYPNTDGETAILEFCLLDNGNIGLLEAEKTIDLVADNYNFRIIDIDNNTLSTGNSFTFSFWGINLVAVNDAPYGQNPRNIDLIGTTDGSMALAGLFSQPSLEVAYPYILKPDANGEVFTVEVSGSVFADLNNNCNNDAGDIAVPNNLINIGFYTTLSDENGLFSSNLLEANVFEISNGFVGAYPYDIWETSPGCPESYEADLNNGAVDGLDFAISPLVEECPRLTVQVLAPFMRPGFANVAALTYSNIGSAVEDSAYVYLTLEPSQTLDSASETYTYDPLTNTYEFFVGEIGVFETGTIHFEVYLPVETPVDETVCIESRIAPFNRCNIDFPNWDGSELRIAGVCEGDSILFAMENIGEEDMALSRNYVIYSDDLLIDIGDLQLDANEVKNIRKVANGQTYRMEADQTPNFPEPSFPEATVETCNDTNDPSTLGLVLGTPRDDQAHYRDIECTVVTGSYDPNDKQVVPSGISDQNYVNLHDALEYTIRFQNTGNDTAFNVFILDTLSEFLDLNTFNPGPATHDYELSMLPGRVIRWDFPNILLPDSTTNLVESQGALRFTIRAVQDIPQPTEIHNTAAIFFDFNEPIITEDMFVTVCDDCLIQTLASDGVYFDGKVLLEGTYSGAGLMTSYLQELIPLTPPFSNFPYLYNGNEQLEQIPDNMVDWVLVEARSGTPASSGQRSTVTVETKAAILLNDGSIRGVDGISGVQFENLESDIPYHFCIRHRNHLDVFTATALFPTENMVYDFTTGVGQALGAAQMKWFGADEKAVMYVGDFNADGVIQTTDYDMWANEPAAVQVYDLIDANLDGVIQVSDYDRWFFNKAKVGNVEIGF